MIPLFVNLCQEFFCKRFPLFLPLKSCHQLLQLAAAIIMQIVLYRLSYYLNLSFQNGKEAC